MGWARGRCEGRTCVLDAGRGQEKGNVHMFQRQGADLPHRWHRLLYQWGGKGDGAGWKSHHGAALLLSTQQIGGKAAGGRLALVDSAGGGGAHSRAANGAWRRSSWRTLLLKPVFAMGGA
eukprot:358148-Chlamydomonas_euryale.AAC.3